MTKSSFGYIIVLCEEGHEWKLTPEEGGYFDYKFLEQMVLYLINPSKFCEECGRPFYQISIRRHHNGQGEESSNKG